MDTSVLLHGEPALVEAQAPILGRRWSVVIATRLCLAAGDAARPAPQDERERRRCLPHDLGALSWRSLPRSARPSPPARSPILRRAATTRLRSPQLRSTAPRRPAVQVAGTTHTAFGRFHGAAGPRRPLLTPTESRWSITEASSASNTTQARSQPHSA